MSMNQNDQAKPVLVTGATGFTGGRLARVLLDRGQQVRAMVRDLDKAQHLSEARVDLVRGDLTNPDDVDHACQGVSIVYNVAAVFRTAGHPDSYYRDVHVGGTENIIAAARKHGVDRVVHCSTVGVHGNVSRIPSNEQAPYNPGDIYQQTKLEGELVVQNAIRQGLPASIVRPAGIYGPGDMRFLKLFRTIHRRKFRMFGSGEVVYHLTYIDDLVDGIILCGEHPGALGEIFIISGAEYVTLNDLVEMVADAVGVRPPRGHLPFWPLMAAAVVCEAICRPLGIDPPLHKRRVEFFIKNRAFTCDKARTRLGYEPKVDLTEGLARTAQWYFEQGLLERSA